MADEYDQEIGPELAMHLAIEREVGIGVVSKNYSDADMRERSLRIDGENKVRIEAHLSPGNPVPQAGIEFPAVYGERLYTFVYKSFSSTRGTIARGFHLFTRQNAVMTNSMVILKLVDGGRSARVFVIPPEYLGSNLVKDVSDIPIYRLDYIPENIRMVSIGFLTSYKHTDSVAKIYQDQKTFNGFRGIHEVGFTPDVGFSKATLKNNSVFLVGYLSHLSMEDINMLRGILNQARQVVIISQHGFSGHVLGGLVFEFSLCPRIILAVSGTTAPPIDDISSITDAPVTSTHLGSAGFSPSIEISETEVVVSEYTESANVPETKSRQTLALLDRTKNLTNRHTAFHI